MPASGADVVRFNFFDWGDGRLLHIELGEVLGGEFVFLKKLILACHPEVSCLGVGDDHQATLVDLTINGVNQVFWEAFFYVGSNFP